MLRRNNTARALQLVVCNRCTPALVQTRSLAGVAKVEELDLTVHSGPPAVPRTTPLREMGVLYAPGTPSPSESVSTIAPIKVEGMIAKCDGGGGPLGHPIEFVKLSR